MSQTNRIPGPPPVKGILDQIRLLQRFSTDILGTFDDNFNQYGDIVGFEMGGTTSVLISRPEHIREILVEKPEDFHKASDYKDRQRGMARFLGNGLVTSDGEFWKRQRKLVAPAFHSKRIESYAETMVSQTQKLIDGWRGKHELDIDQEMMRGTMTIVAQTLFSADVAGDTERVGRSMTTLQEMMTPFNILPSWLPTPAQLRTRRAVRDLDAIIYRLIHERRAEGEDRGDLLSMLLLARDDDGGAMTDLQVRDEVVTLFLAGHETTANALNFTWMLLAQNPDAEAKLHDELDTALAGRTPTLADLKQLPYTEMIVKEAMRLYPPAYSFGRQAIRDTSVGGYPIPAGTEFNIVNYRTHRDPAYWDQPERFIPERFGPDREGEIVKYSYIPFGGGPRVCIGNSFAMMEARLMLATIAQRYRLRLPPGYKVALDPMITMRSRGGMPMRVEVREPVFEREYA